MGSKSNKDVAASIGETETVPHNAGDAGTAADETGWFISLYGMEKEESIWTVHLKGEEGLVDVGFDFNTLEGTTCVKAKSKSGIVYTVPVMNPSGMFIARLDDDGSIPLA